MAATTPTQPTPPSVVTHTQCQSDVCHNASAANDIHCAHDTHDAAANHSDTDRYVVIGNPIAHSRSPAIHQHFAALTGQALQYERCLAPLDGFADTLAQLCRSGVRGCNVTVPFKQQAAAQASIRSQRVELAGAANTLLLHADGRIEAHNTDGIGLVRDITTNAGIALANRHLLLLGAGGAAAGALAPLLQERPASITVANRSAERAQALVALHQPLAQQLGVALQALALDAVDRAALPRMHALINATASSLQGQALPLQRLDQLLIGDALAYDMMYGPAAQGFLGWVRQHCPEARLRDGLGMLVEQAAESFQLWRGLRPPSQPVLQTLRQELDLTP